MWGLRVMEHYRAMLGLRQCARWHDPASSTRIAETVAGMLIEIESPAEPRGFDLSRSTTMRPSPSPPSLEAGRWKLGDGSWELGAGSLELGAAQDSNV